jgi:serine protease AprX
MHGRPLARPVLRCAISRAVSPHHFRTLASATLLAGATLLLTAGPLLAASARAGSATGPSSAATPDKRGARLQRVWSDLDARTPIAVWVFLRDKGAPPAPGTVQNAISARARARRLKVRPAEPAVEDADLPLDAAAVAEVVSRAERLRQRSRWFNAVSVEATPAQISQLLQLPCVRSIELVARARRAEPGASASGASGAGKAGVAEAPGSVASPRAIDITGSTGDPTLAARFNYGAALGQMQIIHVVDLHNLGYDGHGVLVAHFDDGYSVTHESLAGLDIVGAHDFVDHDADPAPQPGCMPECGYHGVITLSLLGGFAPGKLVSPAFGASYLLARTENDQSETPVEEDNWVAAAEWADSLGADIISSSVGYNTFDAPFPSWTWQDMDGNTTRIVRAADMAVARGIFVVQAVGNEGFVEGPSPPPNTLVTPADGDSVLAVGAVDPSRHRWLYTSWGPTADGRIKPDVMAAGANAWFALGSGPAAYGSNSGTSLACPMVAGTAALLLQAFPDATPIELRDALRATASRAAAPDRYEGWGIIDALAALQYLIDHTPPTTNPFGGRPAHAAANPYPFAAGLSIRYEPQPAIHYQLLAPATVALEIHDVRGRLLHRWRAAAEPAAMHALEWNGLDDRGRPAGRGVYLVRLEASPLADPRRSAVVFRKITLLR